MVGLDGEKMSKSKGNLVLVSKLRADGVDPMAIRLALLAHDHRTDWEWRHGDLTAGERRLERWRAGFDRPAAGAAAPVVEQLRSALADGIDTPAALAAVDAWVAAEGEDEAAPEQVRAAVDALLGVV
jgi:L-cysteine:1D-myo-inositol 2-amino-2-deoxy-alpha-D-glucopyranoside ligase